MKPMKCLLAAIALLFTTFSWGQTLVHIEELAVSGPDEYTIVVSVDNLPAGALLTRYNFMLDSVEVIDEGDTLYQFRPDAPDYERIVAYYDGQMIASAGLDKPTVRAIPTLGAYTLPSSIVNADGSMTFTFDRVVPQSSIAIWNIHNGLAYPFTTTDEETYTASNLHTGVYAVDIYPEALDSTVHMIQFLTFLGDPAEVPNQLLYLSATGQWEAYDGLCNASIELTPINNTGDVTYTWQDNVGAPDTNAWNAFCPGSYRVLAEDEAGNASITHIHISGMRSHAFGYAPGDGTPADTLKFTFYNCNFDYNQPVDSVHYDTLMSPWYDQVYSVVVHLTSYQSGDSLELWSSFFYDTTTAMPYILHRVQCTTDPVNFYVTRSGMLPPQNLPPVRAPHPTIVQNLPVVYPNPVRTELHVSGGASGIVTDLSGKTLATFTGSTVSLAHLSQGIYLVQIDGSVESYPIVKE